MSGEFRLANIVIADDDQVDRMAVRRALSKAGLTNPVTEVTDGAQLLDLVARRGAYADAPRPDLVLLDLNMPNVDGREVLDRLDGAGIPIVVMTVSAKNDDIRQAYKKGAKSYLPKPVAFSEIRRVVAELEGYSFSIVRRDES